MVAATQCRIYLELRAYEDDKIKQNELVYSLGFPPSYEIKDVAFDDGFEVIAYYHTGGTNIAGRRMKIYGIINDKIQEFGDFPIEEESEFFEPYKKYSVNGRIKFPQKNEISCSYRETITVNGRTSIKVRHEKFVFNEKTRKYEKTDTNSRAGGEEMSLNFSARMSRLSALCD
jgi:hypothetical protein